MMLLLLHLRGSSLFQGPLLCLKISHSSELKSVIMISISTRRSLNAVDEENVNKDLLAEIEIIMTEFSSDEWDIFRQSKGPWNNDGASDEGEGASDGASDEGEGASDEGEGVSNAFDHSQDFVHLFFQDN